MSLSTLPTKTGKIVDIEEEIPINAGQTNVLEMEVNYAYEVEPKSTAKSTIVDIESDDSMEQVQTTYIYHLGKASLNKTEKIVEVNEDVPTKAYKKKVIAIEDKEGTKKNVRKNTKQQIVDIECIEPVAYIQTPKDGNKLNPMYIGPPAPLATRSVHLSTTEGGWSKVQYRNMEEEHPGLQAWTN